MRKRTIICLATCPLLFAACGGGSSTPPPPATLQTYTATAVAVDLARSADGQALPVDNLPAEGATLAVQ